MGIHNIQHKLNRAKFKSSGATPNKMMMVDGTDALMAYGTTVPSATSGYSPGAIFWDTDASEGVRFLINKGTVSSCTFVDVLDVADSDSIKFGADDDFTMAFDGTQLEVLPKTDDTGAFNVGDGTTDCDMKVFLGATTAYVELNVGDGRMNVEGAEIRFGDSDKVEFGDAGDITMSWDGTDFDILQATVNSSIKWGIDGAGIDQVFYGDTASAKMTWDQSADELVFSGASCIRPKYEIVNKTADFTITTAEFGKIMTNRGDGDAIVWTLPAASGNSGEVCYFFSCSDNNMTVTGTDEQILCFNDLTADSIAFSTSSEKIGGGIMAVCDGSSWICVPLATETQTVTIASA